MNVTCVERDLTKRGGYVCVKHVRTVTLCYLHHGRDSGSLPGDEIKVRFGKCLIAPRSSKKSGLLERDLKELWDTEIGRHEVDQDIRSLDPQKWGSHG